MTTAKIRCRRIIRPHEVGEEIRPLPAARSAHHAPPTKWGRKYKTFPRRDLRPGSLYCSRCGQAEGSGAPRGASNRSPRGADKRCRLRHGGAAAGHADKCTQSFVTHLLRSPLAFRRSTCGSRLGDRTPPLSSRPCFPPADSQPAVARPSPAAVSESTSRPGLSAGGRDARSRPGAGANPPAGTASRSAS